MAKIQITLDSETYTKEELEGYILLFAKATGYDEASEESSLEFVTKPIGKYFRETIVAYNSVQAMEQAREQAGTATNTALDAITLTVGVEA